MPEFGMMFKLNADYDNVEWYGYGTRGNLCRPCRHAGKTWHLQK
ncbi:MAG: hypothetical protein ACLVCH_07240 [Roseburia inulinivorans]